MFFLNEWEVFFYNSDLKQVRVYTLHRWVYIFIFRKYVIRLSNYISVVKTKQKSWNQLFLPNFILKMTYVYFWIWLQSCYTIITYCEKRFLNLKRVADNFKAIPSGTFNNVVSAVNENGKIWNACNLVTGRSSLLINFELGLCLYQ